MTNSENAALPSTERTYAPGDLVVWKAGSQRIAAEVVKLSKTGRRVKIKMNYSTVARGGYSNYTYVKPASLEPRS